MKRPFARHVLPSFTERTSSGARTLDPYSKLLEERIIFLGSPIDDTSATDVIAQFMHLEHAAPDRDISVYINSPGGSFDAMTAIYDTMRYVSCEVETVCLGQAASCAAVLLAAGAPGKRGALPGARVLLCQPSLPEPIEGPHTDLEIHAAEIARVKTLQEVLLSRHTGRTRERVAADIERDHILTAQEGVEYGLVDRVVTSRKKSTATAGAK
ncbi:ATP-dependent Clp protease proteolytic subunit [Streptomyces tsukubensis]|uniref:ATP-dependent Clp protease proteolytic subunit n=1 Tax=Streptomyces tsukubensis TaxID=83656 RepID=A0A1V4A6L9_9ACTN|nr:ATP-dependent Clp protease proteolytic subunit [Streptomyces tsukubensis]OON77324.1 ATP-dependent Clp protease proteolytic subunit [Streptomyces tsukubensis]QFR92401.1 ATP-dependent Clp protease proteolytic subunit [Streptomyces tsukubensis]